MEGLTTRRGFIAGTAASAVASPSAEAKPDISPELRRLIEEHRRIYRLVVEVCGREPGFSEAERSARVRWQAEHDALADADYEAFVAIVRHVPASLLEVAAIARHAMAPEGYWNDNFLENDDALYGFVKALAAAAAM